MQKVPVKLGERSYDIVVECGCLARVGSFVRDFFGSSCKVGVVTSETVSELYLDTVVESLADVGCKVTSIVIPDGEEHKTLTTYEHIMTKLIEARFERTSVILPLGGGVVGDTAGFVAATFLRGIQFIHVPTTIVAQVDSSIGGKVAVNHPLGKNLIGSIYQPRGVWIDPRVLSTLEQREVVSGMAEAVKHAVIRDEKFFTFLEESLEPIMTSTASDDTMETFITWNCRIKADVVSADEHETGLRAILNYGHTVGHALETVTNYNHFKHGEAVMLGMISSGRIAVQKGLMTESDFNRQNRLLARVGLTWDVNNLGAGDILKAMARDKKVLSGKIRFVLPDRIGSVRIYSDVTEDEMRDGIEYMLSWVSKK